MSAAAGCAERTISRSPGAVATRWSTRLVQPWQRTPAPGVLDMSPKESSAPGPSGSRMQSSQGAQIVAESGAGVETS